MAKIGAELPKLSQSKTGYPFLGPPCIQGGPKSKPLPNDQKIVLNRIKACQ